MGSIQSTTATSQHHDRRTKGERVTSSEMRRPTVYLRGCGTDEEHKLKKRMMIELLQNMKGEEGLSASGLEYRLVTLGEDGELVEGAAKEELSQPVPKVSLSSATENNGSCHYNNNDEDEGEEEKKDDNPQHRSPSKLSERLSESKMKGERHQISCSFITMTRLFHTESNTMITANNRKEFIADGAMYEIISRLCQEYSQDVMIRDGHMEWVEIAQQSVADENQLSTEPTRALVSTRLVEDESILDNEPTLLIVTGKGRVRAGVFSRQHLLTSGLECSSAVQFVREAHKRKINLIILDPNANGDRFGMVNFENSMRQLFSRWEKNVNGNSTVEKSSCAAGRSKQNLYVLSHSQSGSQFVRYLLNKAESYLPHIGAIAFTDSTHNIQWVKRKNLEALKALLESGKSIYFRRSDETIDYILSPLSSLGQEVDTDEFWEHRFGKIQTFCAGTSEHSLTNWFARDYIWNHFDRYLVSSG